MLRARIHLILSQMRQTDSTRMPTARRHRHALPTPAPRPPSKVNHWKTQYSLTHSLKFQDSDTWHDSIDQLSFATNKGTLATFSNHKTIKQTMVFRTSTAPPRGRGATTWTPRRGASRKCPRQCALQPCAANRRGRVEARTQTVPPARAAKGTSA